MRDENPIRTLGDYSKPSHEGYRNAIELPIGNTVVPLRSDTIRLVQTGCSFQGIRFEDPNQHLKDFLKLVDSLDLNGDNREKMRLIFELSPEKSNGSPILNSFAFRKRTCLTTQPQALETTFEAQVRDYMAAHAERMKQFKNAIFKQRGEINGRMTEMFGLLKELITSKAPKKVLIREETKSPVIKNVNSISLVEKEKEENDKHNVAIGNTDEETNGTNIEVPVKEVDIKNKAKNEVENKPTKKAENDEVVEASSSWPVEYYLKHRIIKKLIEGIIDNPRFNDSETRVGKVKGKTYNVLPKGPVYDAILKKKITKKEDIRGDFEIP
nr:zinc finger, CCHC-type [Tanacetum cinerariifolium]